MSLKTTGDRVLSEDIALKATEIMETVLTSGTGRGARLASGQEAAGKTGTSEHGRDLWFVGFTPQISCAVWTGYRDEKETSLYGGTTSTPIWKKFMDKALKDKDTEDFADPDEDNLLFITGGASAAEIVEQKADASVSSDASSSESE